MTDKEKLEKIKKLADAMYYAAFNLTTDASLLRKAMDEYHQFIINEYHKEESVSEEWIKELTTKLDSMSKEDFKKVFDNYAVDFKEEPVSEELEEAAKNHAVERFRVTRNKELAEKCKWSFKAGAKWKENHLWKSADGDDLPDIDREVIALLDNGKVVFAHRPPKYWDGKDIVTGKVTRNYPKTYDKGGWNIPDIKFWLDVELSKEIEL